MAWELGDYATLAEVRRAIGIKSTITTDDDLIEEYIEDGSREIERFCGGRKFYGRVETRYYDALLHVDAQRLLLDDDLTGVVSITLGDGSTLPASSYILEPLNDQPKYALRLKDSATQHWSQYTTDPQAAIAINGTWGYTSGTVPPAVIRRACVKYAQWRYLERRTAPTTEASGTGEGEFNITSGLPPDIQRMLASFVRPAYAATGDSQ